MTDPLDELPAPPEPEQGAKLIAAALLGQADALIQFLETHVAPLQSAEFPVLLEGPNHTPLLSVHIEARQVAGHTVLVLVVS